MSARYYLMLSIWTCAAYSAEITPVHARCVNSIFSVYGSFTFAGVGSLSYYEAVCRNPLEVVSIYAASKVYCQSSDIQPGINYLSSLCEQNGGFKLLPWPNFSANLTQSSIDHMRVVDYGQVPPNEILNTSVLISKSFFDIGYETEVGPTTV